MEEAGIDGGGLFKEFITTLCKTAFSPEFGLFVSTDSHTLYPNPSSAHVMEDHLQYFEFLGLIIGKALYDGVLVEPKFAHFFLRKVLGKYNFVDDLVSLDAETYRHLMALKKQTGPLDDLGLNFCVHHESFGFRSTTELIPDGENVAVTQENKLRFISLYADYKLNTQIKAQSAAFLKGLRKIIDQSWLDCFAAEELQQLISGCDKIDIQDWRQHTVYPNYDHDVVGWFWEVVESFSHEEQAKLLLFATSCSRAPLMGFASLQPKFSLNITRGSDDALPTASTCVNLLKMPAYRSRERLREKLLAAINSGAGFDLS
eukprot:TRINITY_DN1080_c0_g3_i1.p1 TRINITY_DN1080_c0_g3~~TRINITY_DN1080_c0_g3_i1.p1  ORF type:complete len:316 (-),score=75.15 TRINITY_DN1080_c0_g3_i1:36-983(-)